MRPCLGLFLLIFACQSTQTAAPSVVPAALPSADTATPAKPSSEPQLPLDPATRKGVLANGMTYYVRKHNKPEKRVLLWLAVKTGSVLEDDDQRGLAHFTEHMAFNGTKNFAKAELVSFMEKSGMKFGADVNAYTSFDETVYQLQLPTDDLAMVKKGMQVLEDWAHGISFDPDEIEKERGVVVEEWRLGRGAQERVFDKMAPVLLGPSKYAERLPIGKKEILQKAPREAFLRFYNDWYRPDLMAVIVVGDIDADAMEKEIKDRFSWLKNPDKPRPRTAVSVLEHKEPRAKIVQDAELPVTSVQYLNKEPLLPEGTKSDYRMFLMQRLYNGILSDRFARLEHDPNSPFAYRFGGASEFVRTSRFMTWVGVVKDGQEQRAVADLLQQVSVVKQHGFTENELAGQKSEILRGLESSAAEKDKTNAQDYAGEMVRNFLEGEVMPGIDAEVALAKELLPTIRVAELNRAARDWNDDAGEVITLSGSTKAKMPNEATLLGWLKEAKAKKVAAWVDEAAQGDLLDTKPTPGKIVKEIPRNEIGGTEYVLSNGVHVVIKPTDFQADQILLSGFRQGGVSLASDKIYDSARFASGIVQESGLGKFSSTQLTSLLKGKVVRLGVNVGELEETISGAASPKDLETMFQLLYLNFAPPRKDEAAFLSWKSRTAEILRNQEVQPETYFSRVVEFDWWQRHPRRKPVTAADIEKVSLDTALNFQRDRMKSAQGFKFVLVGNIDPAQLKPMLEMYVASLPNPKIATKWHDVGARFSRGAKTVEVKRGQEPKSTVRIRFSGREKWTLENADDLDMLSTALQIRLREVLREDLGGVYGVFASGFISRWPVSEMSFSIGFGCAPENVEKLRQATLDVIAAFSKGDIAADVLEKIKEQRKREFETDSRENRFWLQEIAQHLRFGTDTALIAKQGELAARVSIASIQKAARKYLKTKGYFFAVLRPE